MKRMLLITLILALAGVPVLAQQMYVQDKNKAINAWPNDEYFHFQNNGEAHTGDNVWFEDVKAGDTLWTCTYAVWPFTYFDMETQDTCSTDSVNLKVEYWSTASNDTTTMKLIKALTWHPSDGSFGVTTVNAVDTWWCNVGDSAYPGLRKYRLRIIALTGHAKLGGVRLKISSNVHCFK